jgi:hypothetical protein
VEEEIKPTHEKTLEEVMILWGEDVECLPRDHGGRGEGAEWLKRWSGKATESENRHERVELVANLRNLHRRGRWRVVSKTLDCILELDQLRPGHQSWQSFGECEDNFFERREEDLWCILFFSLHLPHHQQYQKTLEMTMSSRKLTKGRESGCQSVDGKDLDLLRDYIRRGKTQKGIDDHPECIWVNADSCHDLLLKKFNEWGDDDFLKGLSQK